MEKVKHCLHRLQHHKVARHSHHLAYVVYYAFALLEDHGAKFFVVVAIAAFHTVATLTGEE